MVRIGVDLGGTKIEAVALDGSGAIVVRQRVSTPRGDYPATVAAITSLVRSVESVLGCQGTVGAGIPGVVSPHTGLVKNANSTWLIGHPLDRDLADALGRPVRVQNDANCFAVSEATDGAGAGAPVVFGVILGTGCGGGITVEGRPITGANAVAGEWGHNPLPWAEGGAELPGPACYCGKHGCLETYLSGPGLAADHLRATGETLTTAEIAARAEAGDAAADTTLRRFEDRLARGLVGVINILDPDVIVLGGGLSNLTRLYTSLPPLIDRYAFSDRITTPIRQARHGDSSGVRGAAWLWRPGEVG